MRQIYLVPVSKDQNIQTAKYLLRFCVEPRQIPVSCRLLAAGGAVWPCHRIFPLLPLHKKAYSIFLPSRKPS